ncbi:MAG: GtrA family protein [Thaumarchaeota archaeon]|nr:GtrA family protein [Nitrososphaerota archaeon]
MTLKKKGGFFTLDRIRRFVKFNVVGLSGVGVNELLLVFIQLRGVYVIYASAIAIEASILSNFFLNDLWTFRDRRSGHIATRLAKFNVLMLAGLVVNLVIVYAGIAYFGTPAAFANLVGIGAAFLLRYALSVKYAWMRDENIETGHVDPLAEPSIAAQETSD